MELTREAVLEQAMKLSYENRLVLIRRLWESVDRTIDPEIEAAWAKEAERRLAAYRRGEIQTVDAEQVFAEIERMLAQ